MYSTTNMCDYLANIPSEMLFYEDRNSYATCAICMEIIKETNTITLECEHKYHASCYSENILSGNNKCPLCRSVVCRPADTVPELSKEMISTFMEELLLTNKGERIKEVFQELGYKTTDLNSSHYHIVTRLLIKFGFNLGSMIRDWIDDGNDRYVNDDSDDEHNITDNLQDFVPRELFNERYVNNDSDDDTDSDMPPLEYTSDGDENDDEDEVIELYPIHLWYSHGMDEEEEEEEEPEFWSQYDQMTLHNFIEKYNLQEYRERLIHNEHLRHFNTLIASDIDDLMWPYGGSGIRPLFTRQEAEDIFCAILQYFSEVYDNNP